MSKRLSPAATVALKEALCAVYWYKADLKSFLQECLARPTLVNTLDWTAYKRQIVSDLVDALTSKEDLYIAGLTRLYREVCTFKKFPHLSQLEGGDEKALRAKTAVEQLAAMLAPHGQIKQEIDEIKERETRMAAKLQANSAVRKKLEDIRNRYMALVVSLKAQSRGFELERVMYDLFELFDLDPKASFKNTGEQIDGAFSLEGTDFLFEARWRQDPSSASDLDSFGAKIQRKLENTLGVFLSINGFTPDGVQAHASGHIVLLLMDGADLMAVLEERIDFVSLLLRKKRHASRTGEIYLRIHEALS